MMENTMMENTMMENTSGQDPDMLTPSVFTIAKICHEANRAWCEAHGDLSQESWAQAEYWQRKSAIEGVLFRLNNPDADNDAQHNAWMRDKINDGWVYGEVKDADKKTHPCIVPFDNLPAFQQKKDALFCAIVDALRSDVKSVKKGALVSPLNMGFDEIFKELCYGRPAKLQQLLDDTLAVIEQMDPNDVSFTYSGLTVRQALSTTPDMGASGQPTTMDSVDVSSEKPRTTNLTFGQAIERLKAGKRVARAGWNGKGMFIWLRPAGRIPKAAIYDPALRAVIDQHVDGDTFEALPSIRMWTTDCKVLTGWLASQTDMLSEDWMEVI